jgi:ABC-type nitrate/sulfonate/bicarbonate transport system permease component
MSLAAQMARAAVSPLLFVVGLIAAWYLTIWALALPPYLMPTPLDTVDAFLRERGRILQHVSYTLSEAATGLLISAVLAIGVAGLSVAIPPLGRAMLPFAVALRSTPVVAMAPLITLVIGRGFASGVAVVVIASFFPIMINAIRGFSSMLPAHGELLHVLAAGKWQAFRYVRVPFALPHIFAGLRVAAPLAVLGAMLAEWLTGTPGIGYLILDAAAMREQELLWSAICTSMALALAVYWSTTSLEQWLRRQLT